MRSMCVTADVLAIVKTLPKRTPLVMLTVTSPTSMIITAGNTRIIICITAGKVGTVTVRSKLLLQALYCVKDTEISFSYDGIDPVCIVTGATSHTPLLKLATQNDETILPVIQTETPAITAAAATFHALCMVAVASCQKSNTISVCTVVRFAATNNRMTISGSDLQVTSLSTLPCEGPDLAEICVDEKTLRDQFTALPQTGTVTITTTATMLQLAQNGRQWLLPLVTSKTIQSYQSIEQSLVTDLNWLYTTRFTPAKIKAGIKVVCVGSKTISCQIADDQLIVSTLCKESQSSFYHQFAVTSHHAIKFNLHYTMWQALLKACHGTDLQVYISDNVAVPLMMMSQETPDFTLNVMSTLR